MQRLIQLQINLSRTDEFICDVFLDDDYSQENYELIMSLLHKENSDLVHLLIHFEEITAQHDIYRRTRSLIPSARRRALSRKLERQKRETRRRTKRQIRGDIDCYIDY